MDLTTVAGIRAPTGRSDLALGPADAFLAGGSWLFSEPQLHLTGLVDLTRLGWDPLAVTDEGLSVAATCTLAELAGFRPPVEWIAHPLFRQCCEALLGSFKVWNVATVGGNICLALPAGPMTSLAAALDADGVIWAPDGGSRRMPIGELVSGVQSTGLGPGEVLRSIEFPVRTLRARTGFRRLALAPLGRSGVVVIARLDEDGGFVLTVTASTPKPARLGFGALPTEVELADAVHAIGDWYDDAHGAPDWREAMTVLLAEQLRAELSERAS